MNENQLMENITSDIKKYNIAYLRLQFTDLLGKQKNVEVPSRKLNDVLDGKIMFDGSSVQGFTRIHESDMFLKPDLITWKVLHYEKAVHDTGVARLVCDTYTLDGKQFLGNPRTNLKQLLGTLSEYGFSDFNVGFEPEFYLFKNIPTDPSQLQPSDTGGYFDQSPIDESEDCRREIVYELERLGFLVEASHHEVGPGQNEITWKYADALQTADNLQTFKTVVREVATRHGLHATFMAKPYSLIAGSGMHTNLSLFTSDGKNAFFDETDPQKLSTNARYFIAGIMKHAKGLCAITNPTVNSYKRLVPGFEAPCYVAYSESNRSSLIRIPASRGLGTRIEVRNPDAMANPYLALTVLLASGLDGIKNKLEPGIAIGTDIFDSNADQIRATALEHLPVTLYEALQELDKNLFLQAALGEHIYTRYRQAKFHEWDNYHVKVSRWELEKYFSY
ncbi:glutamine synthetase [Erysipelotrichaceae bacterium]|nr:glutamine synthetase [Erysipelotrichaceae bacterium]